MKLTVGARRGEGGFALPTILLVATVMLIVLVSSIAATAASRVSLDSQYYNQLAEQAAQSGMARATECLNANGQTPQWSTSSVGKDLRPNSDCAGTTRSGAGVSEYIINGNSGVSNVRTRYTIESPTNTGIGSQLKIVGITELTRTSSPNSVWRRYDQVLYLQIEPPKTAACPEGFIAVPGDSRFGTDDFCVGKYEAKNVGGKAVSQAAGTPWVNISQNDAIAAAADACSGCSLISESQWLTIAHNLANVGGNWSGGAVGSGYIYSGHNDNSPATALAASSDDNDGYFGTGSSIGNQRRTLRLSNGQVIWDFAGNPWDWTSGQSVGGQPGSAGYTYRDWNAISGTGTLSPNPFPAFGTPAASAWTGASQGIGRIHSSTSETGLKAFLRGGGYTNGVSTGLFAAAMHIGPSDPSAATVGFRVAYDLSHHKKTIFTFDTTAPGCGGTVQLPISAPSSGGRVDWGNGVVQNRTAALQSYTYPSAGRYTVVYEGPIDQAGYVNAGGGTVNPTNAKCLVEVNQWASNISPVRVNFYTASNIAYVAEPPRSVTGMDWMFQGATVFNQNINSWDVSNVTTMDSMFHTASSFNQPLDKWNVSNVTKMGIMFRDAAAFNQPLNSWNTASVTHMNHMFYGATSFNQPLSSWNTANVIAMNSMFLGATSFNQNIGGWNTANVTNMSHMFYNAFAFNQPIGGWNTAKVTNMTQMFFAAYGNTPAFNQPIGSWNTGSVTNMDRMFYNAKSFNQPLNTWNTANVTNMYGLFQYMNYNHPLSSWNTAKVTNMGAMFAYNPAFNQAISTWNTAAVTDMNNMFVGAAFNQNISGWNVNNVTNWTNFRLSSALTLANTPPKFR